MPQFTPTPPVFDEDMSLCPQEQLGSYFPEYGFNISAEPFVPSPTADESFSMFSASAPSSPRRPAASSTMAAAAAAGFPSGAASRLPLVSEAPQPRTLEQRAFSLGSASSAPAHHQAASASASLQRPAAPQGVRRASWGASTSTSASAARASSRLGSVWMSGSASSSGTVSAASSNGDLSAPGHHLRSQHDGWFSYSGSRPAVDLLPLSPSSCEDSVFEWSLGGEQQNTLQPQQQQQPQHHHHGKPTYASFAHNNQHQQHQQQQQHHGKQQQQHHHHQKHHAQKQQPHPQQHQQQHRRHHPNRPQPLASSAPRSMSLSSSPSVGAGLGVDSALDLRLRQLWLSEPEEPASPSAHLPLSPTVTDTFAVPSPSFSSPASLCPSPKTVQRRMAVAPPARASNTRVPPGFDQDDDDELDQNELDVPLDDIDDENDDGFTLLNSYLYHRYVRVCQRALEERGRLGAGRSQLMNTMYHFWKGRLLHKFNRKMYRTFKQCALEDSRFGYRFGVECLLQFYKPSLVACFRDKVFRDFVDIVAADSRMSPKSEGLELLWLFMRECPQGAKSQADHIFRSQVVSYPHLRTALARFDA